MTFIMFCTLDRCDVDFSHKGKGTLQNFAAQQKGQLVSAKKKYKYLVSMLSVMV